MLGGFSALGSPTWVPIRPGEKCCSFVGSNECTMDVSCQLAREPHLVDKSFCGMPRVAILHLVHATGCFTVQPFVEANQQISTEDVSARDMFIRYDVCAGTRRLSHNDNGIWSRRSDFQLHRHRKLLFLCPGWCCGRPKGATIPNLSDAGVSGLIKKCDSTAKGRWWS